MLTAGQLRHRIKILARSPDVDRAGQPDGSWKPIAKGVPAEVLFTSGSEGRRGERTEATATHQVTMRHRFGVTPTMRFEWEGQTLEVESVRETVCVCRQVVQ